MSMDSLGGEGGLWDQADEIIEDGRHAGHHRLQVWAALKYVADRGAVNKAYVKLQKMYGSAGDTTIPRWLIDRWAHDAGLVNTHPHRHIKHEPE